MASNKEKGVLVALAAGAAAFFLIGKKKAKASVLPPPPPPGEDDPIVIDEPPVPPKGGSGGGGGGAGPTTEPLPKGIIGGSDPQYDWAQKDRWPHQGAIGHSLMVAGYNVDPGWQMPGYSMTTQKNRAQVKNFQRDFNAVMKSKAKPCIPGSAWSGTVVKDDGTHAKPPTHLTEDGWIGPQTWRSMRWVFLHAAPPTKGGVSWPEIVQCARDMP